MPVPVQSPDGLISKRPLSSSVYERLLEDIVTGRYGKGERLHVNAIAVELGVSRTPVREAIQRLSMTQFVSIARNSRTEVAEWSAEDMRDRVEILSRLLSTILRDPRTDRPAIAEIAESAATPSCGDGVAADAHLFLGLAERIVNQTANRIGSHNATELITPLRMFFRDSVLRDHCIDIAPERQLRQHLLAAVLDALTNEHLRHADHSLDSYLTMLASAVAPRSGDMLTEPTSPIERNTLPLHLTQ